MTADKIAALKDELVLDLADWWHCYGGEQDRRPWCATGEQLSLALDEAARSFVEHALGKVSDVLAAGMRDIFHGAHAPAAGGLDDLFPIEVRPFGSPGSEIKIVHHSRPMDVARGAQGYTATHLPTGVEIIEAVVEPGPGGGSVDLPALRDFTLTNLAAAVLAHLRSGGPLIAPLGPETARLLTDYGGLPPTQIREIDVPDEGTAEEPGGR